MTKYQMQHGVVRRQNPDEFIEKLTSLCLNRWEVMSSGFDGTTQTWWAVLKREVLS